MLNAKCFLTAKTRALVAVARLDDDCSHPRISDPDLIGQHLLKTLSPKHVAKADLNSAQSFPLSEALKTYLIIKGKDKGNTFHTAAERACKYLVEAKAHKHFHEYTSQYALVFRDTWSLKV